MDNVQHQMYALVTKGTQKTHRTKLETHVYLPALEVVSMRTVLVPISVHVIRDMSKIIMLQLATDVFLVVLEDA